MELRSTNFQENLAGRLARIFPSATPMAVPVRVERESGKAERTTIEYGTPREVIFCNDAGLNLDESLRLRSDDGLLDVTVCVIAIHWNDLKQTVAARFQTPVKNWIKA